MGTWTDFLLSKVRSGSMRVSVEGGTSTPCEMSELLLLKIQACPGRRASPQSCAWVAVIKVVMGCPHLEGAA